MRRGALLVLVNFGDAADDHRGRRGELLFETESGVDLDGGVLRLPRPRRGVAGSLVTTVAGWH